MKLWVDGEAGQEELVDALTKPPGIGGKGLSVGARFRGVGIAGGAVHRLRRWDRCLDAFGVGRALDQAHGLGDGGCSATTRGRPPPAPRPSCRADAGLRRAIAGARKALLQATMPVLEVPVMAEAPWAEPFAHVLERGEYDAPRTEANRVPRRAPTSLAPPEDLPDRLALAGWLTSADHPHTARVAVNRLWMVFFGRGLVATPGISAFKVRVRRTPSPGPARAALRGLRRDVKALCREIVLSATYAGLRGVLRRAGPGQHPPARTEAAADRRDAQGHGALRLGALEGRGRPPVSPYQPAGLWREATP